MNTSKPSPASVAQQVRRQAPVLEHAARQTHDTHPGAIPRVGEDLPGHLRDRGLERGRQRARAPGRRHAPPAAPPASAAGRRPAGRRRGRAGTGAACRARSPAASSRSIAACASNSATSRIPSSAAAASNSRPADDATGALSERATCVRTSATSRGSRRPRNAAGGSVRTGVDGRAAVDRLRAQEVAQRHAVRLLDGERPAGHRRPPEPREPPVRAQVREEDLAAPERAVVAHAQAVVGDAQERTRDAVLRGARRHVGVVVLDGDALRRPGSAPAAYLVDRYSGWRSWTTTSGSRARSRDRWARPSVNARWVARSSRSPLCGATWARPPRASVNVCLSSAPTASSGTGVGDRQRQGSGA